MGSIVKKKPRKLLSDPVIQGQLCLRLLVYWILCYLVTTGSLIVFLFLEGVEPSLLQPIWLPTLLSALVFLPFVMIDLLSFSNRFAGPLVKIRRKFHDLASGTPVESLQLRKDDYLQDIGMSFNLLRTKFGKSNSNSSEMPNSPSLDECKRDCQQETVCNANS